MEYTQNLIVWVNVVKILQLKHIDVMMVLVAQVQLVMQLQILNVEEVLMSVMVVIVVKQQNLQEIVVIKTVWVPTITKIYLQYTGSK